MVYAHAPGSPQHEQARVWFEDALNDLSKVGMPWSTLLAFVRLLGNPRVVAQPAPLSKSWSRVRAWLSRPNVWVPLPTERHLDVITHLLEGESRVDLANDAHLAALAIEHGLTVCSTDRDFARFRDVRWENPLRTG